MAKNCKHCGRRIVLINYAFGLKWMHQPEEASFMDEVNLYCTTTVAEPEEE